MSQIILYAALSTALLCPLIQALQLSISFIRTNTVDSLITDLESLRNDIQSYANVIPDFQETSNYIQSTIDTAKAERVGVQGGSYAPSGPLKATSKFIYDTLASFDPSTNMRPQGIKFHYPEVEFSFHPDETQRKGLVIMDNFEQGDDSGYWTGLDDPVQRLYLSEVMKYLDDWRPSDVGPLNPSTPVWLENPGQRYLDTESRSFYEKNPKFFPQDTPQPSPLEGLYENMYIPLTGSAVDQNGNWNSKTGYINNMDDFAPSQSGGAMEEEVVDTVTKPSSDSIDNTAVRLRANRNSIGRYSSRGFETGTLDSNGGRNIAVRRIMKPKLPLHPNSQPVSSVRRKQQLLSMGQDSQGSLLNSNSKRLWNFRA